MSIDDAVRNGRVPDVVRDSGLYETVRDALERTRLVASRGPDHRRRLSAIDTRIVVSGTRGKSGTTRRLHEVFDRRGYDTAAKITGNRPVVLHNDERHPIERGPRVTMYENEREIREHTPDDVLILENQAITEYTNWIFNERYAKPHVIVIPNVRQDHLDTLGGDREGVARSLIRSIPPGTHVVNAEQNAEIRDYIDRELRPRGVNVTHVDVGEDHGNVVAPEAVYAIDEALRVVGEEPLSPRRRQAYLDEMRVTWTELDEGRVFNAADINDVESTEAVRRALQGDDPEPLQVFMYMRGDRRSRSASFLEYLSALADEGIVDQVHVSGEPTAMFARKASFPVMRHDEGAVSARRVVSEMLLQDCPIFIVGNTVAEFMRDMETAIEERKRDERDEPERPNEPAERTKRRRARRTER